MTVTEFLAWDAGDERAWQLADGEPEVLAPANRTRGTLQAELARVIGNHLDARNSSCVVVTQPGVVPHVRASLNVRVPALAVTCSGSIMEEPTISDPVLVVEIVTLNNQAQVRANLWTYTSIPSVREIVVLRTVTVGADVLRREADGTWPREAERVTDGDLVLDSIGLPTPLADLYRRTRLNPSHRG